MSEIPEEFVGRAKKVLETLDWVQIVAILGVIGIIAFLIWYFYLRKKKETKKA